jgi:hypothetical protein
MLRPGSGLRTPPGSFPAAIVTEWATGRVLRVALPGGGTPASYVTGMKHPLPVLAATGGVLVADWGTGRVYRISA